MPLLQIRSIPVAIAFVRDAVRRLLRRRMGQHIRRAELAVAARRMYYLCLEGPESASTCRSRDLQT